MDTMTFSYKVIGDYLMKVSSKANGYTGNANSYRCEFAFSDEWNGLNKFISILSAGKAYTRPLFENAYVIRGEEIVKPGIIQIGVFGTNGSEVDYKLISTGFDMVCIDKGAYQKDTTEPTPPTPDVWETLVNKTVPKIGDNGNWYIWDMAEETYVDSGYPSKGYGEGGEIDLSNYYTQKQTDDALKLKEDVANKVIADGEDAEDAPYYSMIAAQRYVKGVADEIREDFEQDIIQIDKILEGKADSSKSLSGYGIEDAYTKDETDEKDQKIEEKVNHNSSDIQTLFSTIGTMGNDVANKEDVSKKLMVTDDDGTYYSAEYTEMRIYQVVEKQLESYYPKNEVDSKIGDIENALDELHTYAQGIVSGGDD